MGYEVLDAGRAREPQTGASGPGPVDVVALEDLPDPAADRAGVRPPRVPPWLRRAAARVSPVLAIALVAALAAGVLGGTWYSGRRAAMAKESAARGVVSAFALAVGLDGYDNGSGHMVNVVVRVFNLGTRPLSVAGSRGLAALSDTGVRVTVINGDGLVQPGRDTLLRVRVQLHCDAAESLRLTVPVRSEDGTLHQLLVRDSDQGPLSQAPQQLCAQSRYTDPMPTRLTGSLARPMLELTNTTDTPLTVSLDSGSPLTQSASDYLSLTTRPALPVVVAPHSTRRLLLRIDVQGCHRDLQPLSDGGLGYLGLRVEGSPDGPIQSGIDVNALVAAAMQRSCP